VTKGTSSHLTKKKSLVRELIHHMTQNGTELICNARKSRFMAQRIQFGEAHDQEIMASLFSENNDFVSL